SDDMDIHFPKESLYDTLYLATNYSVDGDQEIFSAGDRHVPLNKTVSVVLKPRKTYARKPTLGVYRVVGRSYSYLGGEWEHDQIRIYTREFGDFTLMEDNEEPTIRVIKADRSSLRFKISDRLSGISSYDAYINGEWVLMHYDAKTGTIWSEKLNKNQSFTGEMELVVIDRAGNKSTYKRKIP